MGKTFSTIWKKLFGSSHPFKISILGLADSGKTTLLYKLKLGKTVSTCPTIGSNFEEFTINNVHLQAWDIGGQKSIRNIWDSYYKGSHVGTSPSRTRDPDALRQPTRPVNARADA